MSPYIYRGYRIWISLSNYCSCPMSIVCLIFHKGVAGVQLKGGSEKRGGREKNGRAACFPPHLSEYSSVLVPGRVELPPDRLLLGPSIGFIQIHEPRLVVYNATVACSVQIFVIGWMLSMLLLVTSLFLNTGAFL